MKLLVKVENPKFAKISDHADHELECVKYEDSHGECIAISCKECKVLLTIETKETTEVEYL